MSGSAAPGTGGLELRGVGVRLAGRVVVEAVDLDVAPGEVVVLAGRNGAGKTTLLRAVAGLIPAAGRIALDGRPLAAYGRRELARQIALVPQETQVPFPFRVLELVLMGRAPHHGWLGLETREDVGRARAALERLGIGELAERSALEISGGERQLVMVARALAQDARLLLLDEPTAHLDVSHRLVLHGLVRELAREGRSALVVSHDLAVAARCGDRLALLAGGRILTSGRPDEVLRPELLREALGVEVRVLHDADGSPLVVAERPSDAPSC